MRFVELLDRDREPFVINVDAIQMIFVDHEGDVVIDTGDGEPFNMGSYNSDGCTPRKLFDMINLELAAHPSLVI